MITKEEINQFFKDRIAKEMKIDASEIDVHAEFYTHGLDSITAIYVLDKLEDFLNIQINPIDFWEYPTIEKFSTYLIEQRLKP